MQKALRRGIVVLNIVTIMLIGMLRTVYMLGAFDVSIIPLILASFFVLREDFEFFNSKKMTLWSCFLTGLFLLMLSIEQVARVLVRMNHEPIHMVFKIIYLPVLLIAVYISVSGILQYAMAEKSKAIIVSSADAEETDELKKFMGLYRPTWLIAAVVAFIVLAYYPGEFNVDADICLRWVLDGVWNDWHTVSFLMFIKLCLALFRVPFMVMVVQAVCFVLVQNYAVSIIWKTFQKKKLCMYYAIASVTIGFVAIRYISGFCKDITYFEAMFAFSLSVLEYLMAKQPQKRHYICMAIFGVLASFFRHGAIVPVICVYVVLFLYMLCRKTSEEAVRDKKKELTRVGALFLMPIVANFLVINVLAFGILNAEPSPGYFMYCVPTNIIGGMAYRACEAGEVIDPEDQELMERIMPIEEWAEGYVPYLSDGLAKKGASKLMEADNRKNVILLNAHFLLKNPKSYLLTFFDVNSIVWEIARPFDGGEYTILSSPDYPEWGYMQKGSFYYASEKLNAYIMEVPIAVAILMRGGLSLFAVFVSMVICILKRSKKLWIPMLMVLVYCALMMLSIQANVTRYIFCITQYAIFFSFITWNIPDNAKENH